MVQHSTTDVDQMIQHSTSGVVQMTQHSIPDVTQAGMEQINRSNSSLIIYQAYSMKSKNFIFRLHEIKEDVITGLGSSCSAIPTMTEQCLTHPASYQSSEISKINYENAMIKDFQTMYSLQRVCSQQITSTKKGIKWPTPEEEDTFSQFSQAPFQWPQECSTLWQWQQPNRRWF